MKKIMLCLGLLAVAPAFADYSVTDGTNSVTLIGEPTIERGTIISFTFKGSDGENSGIGRLIYDCDGHHATLDVPGDTPIRYIPPASPLRTIGVYACDQAGITATE